jgi:hypothetical protein
MQTPPVTLLQAIQKALRSKQSAGASSERHAGLFHEGLPGTIPGPIIAALITQGGIGKPRWDVGVVDIVIPRYRFYAEGDIVELYVDDKFVGDQTVYDTNVSLVFAAPVAAFDPKPENPGYRADVHFHTTDAIGGNETASLSTWLPVKLSVPGDPREDLPPGAEVNERLAAPVGVPNVITPTTGVDLPVVIPRYAHMAAGDVITLFWAGVAIAHPPLTAEQLDRDITLLVPDTVIAAWPGAQREVRYAIRDLVQNYSLFSPSAYTDVEEQATLLAPVLIGQVGEEFDPDALAAGTALITVPDTDLRPNDRVTLHCVGQPLSWPYLDYVSEEQPFTGTSLTFSVPNPLVRSLVGSTLRLYYAVQRASSLLRSHNRLARIVGAPLVLPVPQIPSATGGELAPPAGAVEVEVIVRANIAFAPGCDVEVRWLGVDGDGENHLHTWTRPVESPGLDITLTAPIAWVNEIAGGTLDVSYNLRAGEYAYGSDVLRLAVAGEVSLLPVPRFEPPLSVNDELDLDALTGPFHVLVDVSRPSFEGGTATLSWLGSSAGDELESTPIPANSPPLRFLINRSLIEPNVDQNVAVSYQIRRRDGGIQRSRVMTLSVIDGASQAWPPAQVIDASNQVIPRLAPEIEVSPGVWEANSATLWITDPRLNLGDIVFAMWEQPNGTRTNLAPQDTGNGQVRISVPADLLAASIRTGTTSAKINYYAVLSGVPAPPGQERVLEIDPPRPGSLPVQTILQANSAATVDLNTFPGAAMARISNYHLIKAGQTYWLRLCGTKWSNDNWSIRLGTAPYKVTAADIAAGGIDCVIERADLLRLKDQSALRLDLKVGLSSSLDESLALVLEPKTHTLRQLQLDLQAPLIEGLDADNTLIITDPNGTTKMTAVFTPEAGQLVGMKHSGQPERLMPASLEFLIPNSELSRYENSSTTAFYAVQRAAGAQEEHSPVVRINVLGGGEESFSTETPREITPGIPETLRYFTLTLWRGGRIQEDPPQSPILQGRVLSIDAHGGCTLSLHRPATKVELDIHTSITSGVVWTFTLANGQRPTGTQGTPAHLAYANAGLITQIMISAPANATIYIDNIHVRY